MACDHAAAPWFGGADGGSTEGTSYYKGTNMVTSLKAAALFESRRGEWAKAAEDQRKVIKRAGSTPGGGGDKALIAYLIEGKEFEKARKRIAIYLDSDKRGIIGLDL